MTRHYGERAGRVIASLALIGALACGGSDESTGTSPSGSPSAPAEPPAAAQANVDAAAEAEQIFATRCATCHGAMGAGDGPGSQALSPPPRNFQDPSWQAEVDDEYIANIVMYGGAAVGRSPTMPGNPDLTGRPEIVTALVAHVRELGDQ